MLRGAQPRTLRGGSISKQLRLLTLGRSHGEQRRQFHVAIIGSGPAGFYTAAGVMGQMPDAKVDMYEALPVPFGLIRFGIAPDHPEIEQTSHETFGRVGRSENFRFIGNVSVGGNSSSSVVSPDTGRVDLATVLRHYDAVTFAYGAPQDRMLGIPGESLKGVYSARQFVAWYNGLPGNSGFDPGFDAGTEAVIIGQGNVALDVARILLKTPSELKSTDITEEAIDWLSRSRIDRVRIVGRRGPMQAAFTTAEVRDLTQLRRTVLLPIRDDLVPEKALTMDRKERGKAYGKYPRMVKALLKAQARPGHERQPDMKEWSLDFCLSPKEFRSDPSNPTAVQSTLFERTELSSISDPAAQTTGTGEFVPLPSSVVFRSIGYKSTPLQGFAEAGIPFDERRGVIKNDGKGRILSEATGAPIPGLYCSGWVKTGPTGVVAHTLGESHTTAKSIGQGRAQGLVLGNGQSEPNTARGWEAVKAETPSAQLKRVVGWDDWLKIDQTERERGIAAGKPRLKFRSTAEMLSVLI